MRAEIAISEIAPRDSSAWPH